MTLLLSNTCNICECCVQYINYSYSNPAYGNGNCGEVECGGGECFDPPCCCGAQISGTIFSEPYDQECFNILTPAALIYAGSVIDNKGSVGGVAFKHTECFLGYLEKDTLVTPNIDGRRLSLPFFVANDSTCGPYGLSNVNIKWFFYLNGN
jgi:hypothetical protein